MAPLVTGRSFRPSRRQLHPANGSPMSEIVRHPSRALRGASPPRDSCGSDHGVCLTPRGRLTISASTSRFIERDSSHIAVNACADKRDCAQSRKVRLGDRECRVCDGQQRRSVQAWHRISSRNECTLTLEPPWESWVIEQLAGDLRVGRRDRPELARCTPECRTQALRDAYRLHWSRLSPWRARRLR